MKPDDTHAMHGHLETLTIALLRHAARRAPAELCERLEEEWLADLSDRRGSLQRLRFAVGCCWATRVIAADYSAAAGVVATASARVSTAAGALASHSPSPISRRSIVLFGIVALHALLIYGFISGVTARVVKSLEPMKGVMIFTPTEHQPPPSPPALDRRWTTVGRTPFPTLTDLPPIVLDNEESNDPPRPDLGTTVVDRRPPVIVKRISGEPGAGFPATDEFYPASARRAGQQGVTAIQVCVDPRGLLTSDPRIMAPSGVTSIDQAALALAKAGSGHYRATTENGTPVNDCYSFRVRFRLTR
jgi:TonB family protein